MSLWVLGGWGRPSVGGRPVAEMRISGLVRSRRAENGAGACLRRRYGEMAARKVQEACSEKVGRAHRTTQASDEAGVGEGISFGVWVARAVRAVFCNGVLAVCRTCGFAKTATPEVAPYWTIRPEGDIRRPPESAKTGGKWAKSDKLLARLSHRFQTFPAEPEFHQWPRLTHMCRGLLTLWHSEAVPPERQRSVVSDVCIFTGLAFGAT